jgi:hypothetical protein
LSRNAFRLSVLPLVLYAALFAVLAVDVVGRLAAGAPHQETGNLLLLLFFELMRAVRVLFALTLVGLLLIRSADRSDARALSLFLLFGVVAYAMLFSGGGYVGPFQEWLTMRLRNAGLSRRVLYILFGYASWPSWLALAGLVRFAVLFPEPLTVAAVERSGTDDRTGMMRSVPGAGVDIGAVFRRAMAWLVRRGWLEPLPVWLTAAAGAALSIALRTSQFRWALWAFWLFGVAIAITGLRASHHVGGDDARRRLRWIGRGALAGLGLCVAAGVVGLFPGAASAVGVFVLLTLAPGALLLGLGIGLLSDGGVRS